MVSFRFFSHFFFAAVIIILFTFACSIRTPKNMFKTRSTVILVIVLSAIIFIASCTPQHRLVYLQDKEETRAARYDTLPIPYHIKPGDLMHLDIQDFNLESKDIFTRERDYLRGGGTGHNNIGDPQLYVSSFAVDDTGYIHLPVLGSIKIGGMTVEEANRVTQLRVNTFLKDATVKLRLVNFRVSVLGEVSRPGNYYVFQPQVNVLELIAAAGDMTPYGNREDVMLVRSGNGREMTIFLDLTNRNVLHSPYFYLQPGDVVYVQPNRVAKTTGFATIPWGIIFSAISSTILIINFVR